MRQDECIVGWMNQSGSLLDPRAGVILVVLRLLDAR